MSAPDPKQTVAGAHCLRQALFLGAYLGVATCAPAPETALQLKHLQTRVYLQKADGQFVDGQFANRPLSEGERRVFVVDVHMNHLAYFKKSEKEAAASLLRLSDSVPEECGGSFTVIEIGRQEGGGRTIAFRCGT